MSGTAHARCGHVYQHLEKYWDDCISLEGDYVE